MRLSLSPKFFHHQYFYSIATIFIISLIYIITAVRPATPFNYYTLLSASFLKGKFYLDESQSWLAELIPSEKENQWFVVYPPMPAIVSVPFVFLGINNQTTICVFFAILNIILFFIIFARIFNWQIAHFLTIAFSLGTNHWYLATEGSAWYFSHIIAIFFLLLSLLFLQIYPADKSLLIKANSFSIFLSGLCLGAAYWSRLPTILALPFFLYLIFQNKFTLPKLKFKALIYYLLGVSIFLLLNALYNFLRFGTIFDIAYEKIDGIFSEPWYSHGIFSLNYLARNLKFMLAKLPLEHDHFPFLKPSIEGMSMLITSPFLLLVPFFNRKLKWVIIAFFTGILLLAPGLLHGCNGFTQFGYRFGLEASLFFILVIASQFKERSLLFQIFLFLTFFAILINTWGIVFIRYLRIFGW